MEKEGGRQEFRSLEVREASSSHLRRAIVKTRLSNLNFHTITVSFGKPPICQLKLRNYELHE